MFRIVTSGERTFKTKVKFKMPNNDGKFDSVAFTAKFQMLSTEEAGPASQLPAIEFARKVLTGWDEIQDANGDPLPFNEDNREVLLQEPIVAIAIARSYNDAIQNGIAGKN